MKNTIIYTIRPINWEKQKNGSFAAILGSFIRYEVRARYSGTGKFFWSYAMDDERAAEYECDSHEDGKRQAYLHWVGMLVCDGILDVYHEDGDGSVTPIQFCNSFRKQNETN